MQSFVIPRSSTVVVYKWITDPFQTACWPKTYNTGINKNKNKLPWMLSSSKNSKIKVKKLWKWIGVSVKWSEAIDREKRCKICWKLLVYCFSIFRLLPTSASSWKTNLIFPEKNAREIITCHVEAVRLATAQAAQARCINYHEFLYCFAYYERFKDFVREIQYSC